MKMVQQMLLISVGFRCRLTRPLVSDKGVYLSVCLSICVGNCFVFNFTDNKILFKRKNIYSYIIVFIPRLPFPKIKHFLGFRSVSCGIPIKDKKAVALIFI